MTPGAMTCCRSLFDVRADDVIVVVKRKTARRKSSVSWQVPVARVLTVAIVVFD